MNRTCATLRWSLHLHTNMLTNKLATNHNPGSGLAHLRTIWTICFRPQNTTQFPISLLYWSHISFPGAFFFGLQAASSRWGPDLENRVSAEAIRSVIHVVLLSLRSICDTVHCLGERAFFSSSFVAVLGGGCDFFLLNAPIMLYNISCWRLFLSQGNRKTKYLA